MTDFEKYIRSESERYNRKMMEIHDGWNVANENYEDWQLALDAEIEEFDYLWIGDQEEWHKCVGTRMAKAFLVDPIMWFLHFSVELPSHRKNMNEDDLRKHIAKKTTRELTREVFADYV